MTTSYTQKSSSLLIRGSLVQAHLEAHLVEIYFDIFPLLFCPIYKGLRTIPVRRKKAKTNYKYQKISTSKCKMLTEC